MPWLVSFPYVCFLISIGPFLSVECSHYLFQLNLFSFFYSIHRREISFIFIVDIIMMPQKDLINLQIRIMKALCTRWHDLATINNDVKPNPGSPYMKQFKYFDSFLHKVVKTSIFYMFLLLRISLFCYPFFFHILKSRNYRNRPCLIENNLVFEFWFS